MSGFKITNEDDVSNFNLETSKKSNFLIQEESEEESKDQSAASPPPTKPLGILPIISIVKNYKSLFILLFVITFFIFGVVLTNQIPKINQKCAETAR